MKTERRKGNFLLVSQDWEHLCFSTRRQTGWTECQMLTCGHHYSRKHFSSCVGGGKVVCQVTELTQDQAWDSIRQYLGEEQRPRLGPEDTCGGTSLSRCQHMLSATKVNLTVSLPLLRTHTGTPSKQVCVSMGCVWQGEKSSVLLPSHGSCVL